MICMLLLSALLLSVNTTRLIARRTSHQTKMHKQFDFFNLFNLGGGSNPKVQKPKGKTGVTVATSILDKVNGGIKKPGDAKPNGVDLAGNITNETDKFVQDAVAGKKPKGTGLGGSIVSAVGSFVGKNPGKDPKGSKIASGILGNIGGFLNGFRRRAQKSNREH